MTPSLRSRLMIGMLLGMAVLLVAAGAFVYTIQRRELYRAFDTSLLTTAHAIASVIRPSNHGDWFDVRGVGLLPAGQVRQGAVWQVWAERPIAIVAPRADIDDLPEDDEPDEPPPDDRPPHPRGFPGERGLRPRGPEGPPELRNGRAPRVLTIRSPILKGADLPRVKVAPGQAQYQTVSMPDHEAGRAVATQIQLPGPRPGPGPRPPARASITVVAAAGTASIEKELRALGALLIATALGTLALAGAVAWLVVSRGLRPLGSVAQQIAALDEKGLKQRIPQEGTPREIEPVISQLNGLLGRLDQAFERERALTADVAHELRTPVSEIRAIIEITLNRLRDPREYQEAMREALDAICSMQGLIERLLVLARLEAGQTPHELQPTPVQPLLTMHWARAANGALTRGVVFENRCPADVAVAADTKLMDVVLSNVLANAATYTPDGGHITAELQRENGHCRVSVANSGCQLSEEEVSRVFDRFWRADSARSKTGLNCGLGLTLVRRAMEAMGGEAAARISPDRQFVLELKFEAAG